jgi:PTH1 family peptidyl-tRNA hydrolase
MNILSHDGFRATPKSPVKIIVGLGNPGVRYQWTRHNAGFLVVDRLAERKGILFSTRRFKTLCGTGRLDSRKIVLVKPLTFMNLSGEAVKRVAHFFQASAEDLIVVHDDLDLPQGKLRIKRRGGDGGHQGIRSIIQCLGKDIFIRLKVGIGRPPRGVDAAEYVLRPLDDLEKGQFDRVFSAAADALLVMVEEGLDAAMKKYQPKLIPLSQSP